VYGAGEGSFTCLDYTVWSVKLEHNLTLQTAVGGEHTDHMADGEDVTRDDRLGTAVAFLSHSQARPLPQPLLWIERGHRRLVPCGVGVMCGSIGVLLASVVGQALPRGIEHGSRVEHCGVRGVIVSFR
jgi:hypothetical protein